MKNYKVISGKLKLNIIMGNLILIGEVQGYYSLKLMKQYLTLESFLLDVECFKGDMLNTMISQTSNVINY